MTKNTRHPENTSEPDNTKPKDTGDSVVRAFIRDGLKNKVNVNAFTEYHLALTTYTGYEFSKRFDFTPRYDENGSPDLEYNSALYEHMLNVGSLALAAKTAQSAFICECLSEFDRLDFIDHTKNELTSEQSERLDYEANQLAHACFGMELDKLIERMEHSRETSKDAEHILYQEQLKRIKAIKNKLPKAGRLKKNPITNLAHDNISRELLDMSNDRGKELLKHGYTELQKPIKRGNTILNEGEHLSLRVNSNYQMHREPNSLDARILRACGDILDDPLYNKDRAYSLKQIAERMPLSTRNTTSSKNGAFNLMELEATLDMWRNITAEGVIIDTDKNKLEFKRDSDERMLNATKVYINDEPHYYIYSVAINKIASYKGWMHPVNRSLFSGSLDAAKVEETLIQQIIASSGSKSVKPVLTYETLCKKTGYPLDLEPLKAQHQKEKLFNQAEAFLDEAVIQGELIKWYKVTTKPATGKPLNTGWMWGASLEDMPQDALDAEAIEKKRELSFHKAKAKNYKAALKKMRGTTQEN